MKHLLFCCVFWVAACGVSKAMPDPPLQYLLHRAETVVLVKVIASDAHSTTFQRIDALRGQTEAEFIFPDGHAQIGTECLLISQGDLKYGPPRPVAGRPTRGQCCWCGWISLPIAKHGGEDCAEGIFAEVDGKLFSDGPPHDMPRLSLSRIKRLLEQAPYDPHIHDKA